MSKLRGSVLRHDLGCGYDTRDAFEFGTVVSLELDDGLMDCEEG